MDDVLIGALGALGSILFYGTYAVFIKTPSIVAIDIEPIVFQTYKSFACFATSWLVLLYAPLKFTWWGMVGAGLWVVMGIGAFSAVRLAGIGPTQSLWSALSIVVSYIFGAYVFNEPVRNQLLAFVALIVMVAGMMGITWSTSGGGSLSGQFIKVWNALVRLLKLPKAQWTVQKYAQGGSESEKLIAEAEEGHPNGIVHESGKADAEDRFFAGVMIAVAVGFANGVFMIPLKYANKDVVGVEYIVSFGSGAITVALCILAIRSAILVCYLGKPLPSFHFSVLAGPALLSGLFWSAGNFCSIYATMYLGMSLGWPLVNCQLVVSSLWAVFYYKEVKDTKLIAVLLGCSLLLILGAAILATFGT